MQEGEVIAWGALQIAEERREAKGKGERERYNQLNAVPENTKEREEGFFSMNNGKREKQQKGKD